MHEYAIVLNDGETWTSLEGCKIVVLPDSFDQDEQIKNNTVTTVARFGTRDNLPVIALTGTLALESWA